MDYRTIDIADMQCRVFRMAQKKWKLPTEQCVELFRKYGLLEFLADCYDVLHTRSNECAVADLEDILKANGVNVC